MPRPPCCRRVRGTPPAGIFKPVGVPVRDLVRAVLTLDEFEALRLADLEGLYQEEAADRMGVSRPTFGRVIESARRKVADALVNAKALVIAGGTVELGGIDEAACPSCHRRLAEGEATTPGTARQQRCPRCGCRRRWAQVEEED
jgi:predicted DNA-binding protein (UPF0251 family)